MSKPAAASETRVYPSRAACERAHRAHRDSLIAELGWAPEGKGPDAYLASTVEIERWVNEKRASNGQPLVTSATFTTSFNMQKVKTLTVYKFDAQGKLITE